MRAPRWPSPPGPFGTKTPTRSNSNVQHLTSEGSLMLSTRKKIAAAIGLVMATAGVAATADVTSSAAEIPVPQRKAAVSVSIVPSVIGPGKGLQSSSTAKWAVIGRYSPNKEGKKVVLQRQ